MVIADELWWGIRERLVGIPHSKSFARVDEVRALKYTKLPIGYVCGCRAVVASRQLILSGSHDAIAGKAISINTIKHVGSMLNAVCYEPELRKRRAVQAEAC